LAISSPFFRSAAPMSCWREGELAEAVMAAGTGTPEGLPRFPLGSEDSSTPLEKLENHSLLLRGKLKG
jgi:hypothetical protein